MRMLDIRGLLAVCVLHHGQLGHSEEIIEANTEVQVWRGDGQDRLQDISKVGLHSHDERIPAIVILSVPVHISSCFSQHLK